MTLVAQFAAFWVQMTSTIVLARLLTQEDFGLIAMVVAVASFAVPFKDFGLSARGNSTRSDLPWPDHKSLLSKRGDLFWNRSCADCFFSTVKRSWNIS